LPSLRVRLSRLAHSAPAPVDLIHLQVAPDCGLHEPVIRSVPSDHQLSPHQASAHSRISAARPRSEFVRGPQPTASKRAPGTTPRTQARTERTAYDGGDVACVRGVAPGSTAGHPPTDSHRTLTARTRGAPALARLFPSLGGTETREPSGAEPRRLAALDAAAWRDLRQQSRDGSLTPPASAGLRDSLGNPTAFHSTTQLPSAV